MPYTQGQENSDQDIKTELSRLALQFTANKTDENRESLIEFIRNEIENLFKLYENEIPEVADPDLKAIFDEVIFGGPRNDIDEDEPLITLPVSAIKTWQAPTIGTVRNNQNLGTTLAGEEKEGSKQRVLLCFRGDTRGDIFETGFTGRNSHPNEKTKVLGGAYHVQPGNLISLTSSLNSAAIFALYTSGADRENKPADNSTGWVYLIAAKHAYNIATDSLHIKNKDTDLFNMTTSDYLNESVSEAPITSEEIICKFKIQENKPAEFSMGSAFPGPPEGDFIITEMELNENYPWDTEEINIAVKNYLDTVQEDIQNQAPQKFYLGENEEHSWLAAVNRARLTQISQKETQELEGIVKLPDETSERKKIVDIAKPYQLTFHYHQSFNEKPYYKDCHVLRTYSNPDWAVVTNPQYIELKIELKDVIALGITARTIDMSDLYGDEVTNEMKTLLNHIVTLKGEDGSGPFEQRCKICAFKNNVITVEFENNGARREYSINTIATITASPEDNPELKPYLKKEDVAQADDYKSKKHTIS